MSSQAISIAAGLASGLSAPQAQQPLRVSEITRTQLFAPLYVAMGKDFFGKEGLKIDLSSANGGDRVGALILSGGADIGLTGPEVPIYIYNSESPDKPVIFSGMIGTDGFFLLSRNKIDNFNWKMLDGKKPRVAAGLNDKVAFARSASHGKRIANPCRVDRLLDLGEFRVTRSARIVLIGADVRDPELDLTFMTRIGVGRKISRVVPGVADPQ